jgi:transcriptional regulator with XRE-family HTH domain
MYDHVTGKISDEDIVYFRERNRNRVYSAVVGMFSKLVEQENLTKREIALRLGKQPSQITRWLSGPNNWTLDTVSDLLIAMGAELQHATSMVRTEAASNIGHSLANNSRSCSASQFARSDARPNEGGASTNRTFLEAKLG